MQGFGGALRPIRHTSSDAIGQESRPTVPDSPLREPPNSARHKLFPRFVGDRTDASTVRSARKDVASSCDTDLNYTRIRTVTTSHPTRTLRHPLASSLERLARRESRVRPARSVLDSSTNWLNEDNLSGLALSVRRKVESRSRAHYAQTGEKTVRAGCLEIRRRITSKLSDKRMPPAQRDDTQRLGSPVQCQGSWLSSVNWSLHRQWSIDDTG